MAKKVSMALRTEVVKNPEKGGAWLAVVLISELDEPHSEVQFHSAWTSASGAKRWVKAIVQMHTPRKTIKMDSQVVNSETNKPVAFYGGFEYKVDAQ